MKVLLVHIDGLMPNIPLMKLSRCHKDQGDTVFLLKHGSRPPRITPDKVYISCIFRENGPTALGMAKLFSCPVEIGGSGVDLTKELPSFIEHLMPDYDLYGTDYSMGYFSRGCFRACPWCIVPKKEGAIRKHAPISEFWDTRHKKLILFDNNLLGCSEWEEALEFIVTHRLMVNFSQALDIRLVNDDNAKWLSQTHAYTHTFKTPMIHFAFDDVNYEKAVRTGVQTLKNHRVPPRRLTFYILCGFEEPYDFNEDMHRFQVVRELGAHPYIMKYQDRKDIPILNAFDRWVNRRYYTVCTFDRYNRHPQNKYGSENNEKQVLRLDHS